MLLPGSYLVCFRSGCSPRPSLELVEDSIVTDLLWLLCIPVSSDSGTAIIVSYWLIEYLVQTKFHRIIQYSACQTIHYSFLIRFVLLSPVRAFNLRVLRIYFEVSFLRYDPNTRLSLRQPFSLFILPILLSQTGTEKTKNNCFTLLVTPFIVYQYFLAGIDINCTW